jgi:hypothetical protein
MKYIFFILLFASTCFADTKDLSWNRYTTDNFTILSLKNEQGKWLSENLEKIKKLSLTRWGFEDLNFSKECRIFCVPSKELLKELFNADESKFEIIKKDDEIQMTTIWIVLDDPNPLKILPNYISKACFAELELQKKIKLPQWFKLGASKLNCSVTEIEKDLKFCFSIDAKDRLSSEKIFTTNEFKSKGEIILFEKQSSLMCLFLRKEFGEAKLQGFLRLSSKNKVEDVFKMIYGFDSFSDFDLSYGRFNKDLKIALNKKLVPNYYLTISKSSFKIK